MRRVRVALYGVGGIGSRLAKALLQRDWAEIVAAIDMAEDKVGKDIGELIEGEEIGVTVSKNAQEVLSQTRPDVVLHATLSHLELVYPQLEEIARSGADIISTCEELVYPYYRHPELASRIDGMAKERGVRVLGTGVNPGFVMDTLALVLTSPSHSIRSVEVWRILDASTRRFSFQRKIGIGMKPDEFKTQIAKGKISGHVGLTESIAMIADALGWPLDNISESWLKPAIAEEKVSTQFFTANSGDVVGVDQRVVGTRENTEVIALNFQAYAGAPERDEISIEGTPNLKVVIKGMHGDLATIGVVINSIRRVREADPGLLTMKDLPITHFTGS